MRFKLSTLLLLLTSGVLAVGWITDRALHYPQVDKQLIMQQLLTHTVTDISRIVDFHEYPESWASREKSALQFQFLTLYLERDSFSAQQYLWGPKYRFNNQQIFELGGRILGVSEIDSVDDCKTWLASSCDDSGFCRDVIQNETTPGSLNAFITNCMNSDRFKNYIPP